MNAQPPPHAPFSGFTPAPDCIREELGIVAANVFGAVWRFSHQSRGQCDAKLATIAEWAGYGTTVTRQKLRFLSADGWIIEERRDGRPSVYRDAGRWVLQVIGEDSQTPTRRVAPKPKPQRVALPSPTAGVGPPTRRVAPPTAGVGVPQRDALAEEEYLKKEPKKQLKREEKTTADPHTHALFVAICDACGFDPSMLAEQSRADAGALAAECLAHGFSEDLIRYAEDAWYTVKFNFKAREDVKPPHVKQLRPWIGQCARRIAAAERQNAPRAARRAPIDYGV